MKPIYWTKFLIPIFLKTPTARKQNDNPRTDRKSLPCTYPTKPIYPEAINNLKFSYNEANIPTKEILASRLK